MSQEIEVPGVGRLSFPDGMSEQDMAAAIQKNYPQIHQTPEDPPSAWDHIVNTLERFGSGIGSAVPALLQLGANAGAALNKYAVAPVAGALGAHGIESKALKYGDVVSNAVNEQIQQQEADKRAAMEKAGVKGADVAGTIGAIAPALFNGAPATVLGRLASFSPSTLLGKVGMGAAQGAFYGAAGAPVTTGDNFWKQKGWQSAFGGAAGAATPLVTAVISNLAGAGRDMYDVLSGGENSVDRLKRAYYDRLIGNENIPSVQNSLQNADELISGGKPTAAEAVSTNPFGSPIQAQQKVTLATSGGISGESNARLYAQEVARKSAELERNAVTAPMREAALSKATSIDKPALNDKIVQILGAPETVAVTPARRFLGRVANDIGGADSAEQLYGVRKYITDLIDGRVESDKNVAKYAGTQLMAMKSAIDDAIESGGAGASWRDYLNEYASRSQAIQASADRAENMYKPLQRTNISGAETVSNSSSTHLPNLLSRPAMIANWLSRQARGNVEPALDRSMSNDFLNPNAMADVLARMPVGQQQSALADALRRMTALGMPITAARGMQ